MNQESFKRKLTAVLSADVAGYSRLMAEDESATVKTLETYREVMSALIMQHRGHVIDSPGDNLLAEFTSVVDAVQCAVAVQKEFQARNAELPENRRMEFRIGINLGDVIEEGERIYGDGVNIAARLEALADPGGICVSKTAFDQIETKLPLGYEFLGEQTVKNIPKPVGAYRVLMEPRVTVAGAEVKPWRWQKPVVAAGVALFVVILAIVAWFYFRPTAPPVEVASVEKMASPLPDKPSLAILPFVNMTGDPKQEFFSDGITEEIITALSKIPKIFVIASHSTFAYKGRPVKVGQVAEDLGVRYVLEGSVRRSEDRLRITAQLIDALEGHHLWAERYDRKLKEMFALQDEITKNIIIALQVKLTPGEQTPVYAKGTDNLEAYLKATEGWWYGQQMTKEGTLRARQLAEEAIALDPNYAYAHHLLGRTHGIDVWLGLSRSPRESLKRCIELEMKAITLDSSLAIAHASLGYWLVTARQYDKAIAAGERAISLEPTSAEVLSWHAAILTWAGRNEEAIPLFREALRLNPKPSNLLYRHFGTALANTGQYEEAIALQKKAIEKNPDDIFAYMVMASVCSMAGREAEARSAAKEVLRLNPNFSVAQVRKVRPDKDRAVAKRWCDTLREAGLPETPPLPLPDKPSIAVLPFVNMSGDPEQEYFSDGITEEIITALSKTPKMFVIARTSSFKYKGKEVDVRTVGRELGVRYVLEGSVRRSKDQLRITAQLVDTKTGNHLWAERYDRVL
jgi:adenylate cyclase